MQQGYVYEGEIYSRQMQIITWILGDLEARRTRPDWDAEIAEVVAAASGEKEPCRVTVDVAVGDSAADRSGHEYYEIKSPGKSCASDAGKHETTAEDANCE